MSQPTNKLPCCGYTVPESERGPVSWNPYSGAVQCHNCGQTYQPGIRWIPFLGSPDAELPKRGRHLVYAPQYDDKPFTATWNGHAWMDGQRYIQQLSQNYQNHQQNNHMIKMRITATAVVEFDEESPALLKQSLEAEAGLEAFEQLEAASTMDHEEYQFEVTVEEVK
jgi:hypothetical protein